MKHPIFLTMILVLAITLPTSTAAGEVPLKPTYTAKVLSIKGSNSPDAQYKSAGKWRRLDKDAKLKGKAGTAIKSGPNTEVNLELGPLMKASIESDSKVDVRSFYFSRWEDQAVFFLGKGAITMSSKKDIGHDALAVVFTDEFSAHVGEGKMKVSIEDKKKVVSSLSGHITITEREKGISHHISRGEEIVFDEQGIEVTEAAQPFPWTRLLWLLIIPVALLAWQFLGNGKKPPSQRRNPPQQTWWKNKTGFCLNQPPLREYTHHETNR